MALAYSYERDSDDADEGGWVLVADNCEGLDGAKEAVYAYMEECGCEIPDPPVWAEVAPRVWVLEDPSFMGSGMLAKVCE